MNRHRIASFSQESTRYCNYGKEQFDNGVTFIKPCFWENGSVRYNLWARYCQAAEEPYLALITTGSSPQEARSVLPNSTKTEIVITANPREWLHIFDLRCAESAHPQMRELMRPMRAAFIAKWPSIFGSS